MLIISPSHKMQNLKEIFRAEDGSALLFVNISYPAWGGRGRFAHVADAFYKKSADAFYDFAKNNLSRRPLNDPTKPMAAVLKANVTLDGRKFASVLCEASVFNGGEESASSHSTQLWNKEDGTILRWGDIFTKNASKIFPNADRRLFYFTEKGVCVISKDGQTHFCAFGEADIFVSGLTIG